MTNDSPAKKTLAGVEPALPALQTGASPLGQRVKTRPTDFLDLPSEQLKRQESNLQAVWPPEFQSGAPHRWGQHFRAPPSAARA